MKVKVKLLPPFYCQPWYQIAMASNVFLLSIVSIFQIFLAILSEYKLLNMCIFGQNHIGNFENISRWLIHRKGAKLPGSWYLDLSCLLLLLLYCILCCIVLYWIELNSIEYMYCILTFLFSFNICALKTGQRAQIEI